MVSVSDWEHYKWRGSHQRGMYGAWLRQRTLVCHIQQYLVHIDIKGMSTTWISPSRLRCGYNILIFTTFKANIYEYRAFPKFPRLFPSSPEIVRKFESLHVLFINIPHVETRHQNSHLGLVLTSVMRRFYLVVDTTGRWSSWVLYVSLGTRVKAIRVEMQMRKP
jgi:hypothetical protein